MSRASGNRPYASRRDANEPALLKFAQQAFGMQFETYGPLDVWCAWRGIWTPLEIKTDHGVYTLKQKAFLQRARDRSMPVWTWQTEQDVLDAAGARRSA